MKYGLYGGLGLAAAGLGSWWFWPRPRGQQHNMIVVVIDTLRRDALGCYGNRFAISPRIDEISAEGIRFDRAIASSGWTLPSIASLLTGTWPTIHGALGKKTIVTPIRPELPMAAEVFKSNGFSTLGLGNNAYTSAMLGFGRGFDVYDHRHAYNDRIRRADETIDTALKLIHQHRNESNFLFIHFYDPHLDYDPPPGYKAKFTAGRRRPSPPLGWKYFRSIGSDRQAMMTDDGIKPPSAEDSDYIKGVYYGEVNFSDAQVGRLVDGLKKMSLYDQATLVITSDHGEEFWEHGGFEHAHTVYDELIRVPLIMKLPRAVQYAKSLVKAQIRQLDVMPTLFALAGIEKPASFVGRSLMPFIMGQTEEHLLAFSEGTLYGSDKLAWSTQHYTYIVDLNPQAKRKAELYNWRNDPHQKEDLITKQPGIARDLYQEMGQFYSKLLARAKTMSQPKVKNMHPQIIESLKSLGYIR